MASKFALQVSDKPDSQDICFVSSDSYRDLINKLKPDLNIKGNANYMTTPPQCMPDKYKSKDYIQAYQNFYLGEKKHFARYTNRETPKFMK